MFRKLILCGAISGALVAGVSADTLTGEVAMLEELRVQSMPVVEKFADGLLVEAPAVDGFVVMNVRIFDARSQLVLDVQSKGEPVEFFTADLADGTYTFETITVTKLAAPTAEGEQEIGARNFGRMQVRNGELVLQPDDGKKPSELSFQTLTGNRSMVAVAQFLELLVPSASAQQLVTNGTVPGVVFEDTDTGTATDNEYFLSGNTAPNYGFTVFQNDSFAEVIFEFPYDPDSVNSIIVGTNGDMNLVNNTVTIDRSSGEVGIGTTGPSADLDIHSADPDIRLFDESDSSEVEFNLFSGDMRFWGKPGGGSFRIPFRYNVNAPTDSLTIDATGQVGVGLRLGIGGQDPNSFYPLYINSSASFIRFRDATLDQNGGYIGLDSNELQFWTPGATGAGSSTNKAMVIEAGAGADSLVVDTTGAVGIGTDSPDADLDIQATAPDLRFTDNGGGNAMDLELSNNFLRIQGAAGQDIGKINAGAPVGTFTTDAAGRTGYGTANPAASFNVKYRSAHGAVPVLLIQKPNNDEIFKVNFNGDTFVNGAIVHSSDANEKTNVQSVNYAQILEKVATLPIQQWQYKDAVGVDHIGPMAQDFHATFNLGSTNKGIATVDASGVALAAIKALAIENAQLKAEVAELKSDRDRLATLEAVVAELTADQAKPVLTSVK